MAHLTPGARERSPRPGDVRTHHPNPVLYFTPQQAHDALKGTRPRPAYAPKPVGPSHMEISTAKSQLVEHRATISQMKAHIDTMEMALSRFDPQKVVACVVAGYIDPPERVARAAAAKAAGIVSVLTADHGPMIARGEMARPVFDGVFMHQIHDLKQRIVHYRDLAQHTEAHDGFLEYDLAKLDPQKVCAAKVAGYVDPPERVERAAEAAKGEAS